MAEDYIEYRRNNIDEKIAIKADLSQKTRFIIWKIKFSDILDPATVNNENMYVTSADNKILRTNIKYNTDDHYIEIRPTQEYKPDTIYTLNITTNVRSSSGARLHKEIRLPFKVR